jgi:hypothetical protein
MSNFYVSITTIQKYKEALDMLLESLPNEWRDKYILVYQAEEEESYEVFPDGHIEVKIKQNLSDYGNWVGVDILLKNNIVAQDAWFLFIHDTCKFLSDSVKSTNAVITRFGHRDIDILWLVDKGICNICLIRKNGIEYGANLYKNIDFMTKMETIEYEWNRTNHILSPKSFKVKQHFLDSLPIYYPARYVYSNANKREVLEVTSIDMEKYFCRVNKEEDHPFMP